MLSFFGSFFLTDSASLFFCYHGRTLPFIDGVFSRNQVNSTLRGVRAFAVFFSFFFISRMILIYYWLSSSLPVGVFVSLCAAKAPHTSSRTAYFSFCFISSTFGPIFKKGSEDGERKSFTLLYRHSANVDGAEKMMTL